MTHSLCDCTSDEAIIDRALNNVIADLEFFMDRLDKDEDAHFCPITEVATLLIRAHILELVGSNKKNFKDCHPLATFTKAQKILSSHEQTVYGELNKRLD